MHRMLGSDLEKISEEVSKELPRRFPPIPPDMSMLTNWTSAHNVALHTD